MGCKIQISRFYSHTDRTFTHNECISEKLQYFLYLFSHNYLLVMILRIKKYNCQSLYIERFYQRWNENSPYCKDGHNNPSSLCLCALWCHFSFHRGMESLFCPINLDWPYLYNLLRLRRLAKIKRNLQG